jgi:hypothetical protein
MELVAHCTPWVACRELLLKKTMIPSFIGIPLMKLV